MLTSFVNTMGRGHTFEAADILLVYSCGIWSGSNFLKVWKAGIVHRILASNIQYEYLSLSRLALSGERRTFAADKFPVSTFGGSLHMSTEATRGNIMFEVKRWRSFKRTDDHIFGKTLKIELSPILQAYTLKLGCCYIFGKTNKAINSFHLYWCTTRHAFK